MRGQNGGDLKDVIVTQRIEFECCYITNNVLNAHRYRLEASAASTYDAENGASLYFQDFKQAIADAVPDGTYIYNSADSINSTAVKVASLLDSAYIPVVGYPFMITAESLCDQIAADIQHNLPQYRLVEVKLRETADSFVTWTNQSIT